MPMYLLRPRDLFITLSICLFVFSSNSLDAGGLGVTPPEQFKVPGGFAVELVHQVDSKTEGSWVSLTVDPKGRLIACDQLGGLFRIDVSKPNATVEKLNIDFVGAQGLLCAFGSLYANVNSRQQPSGLWRLTDTDGDDQYDTKEHIVPLNGGSEHGPHALILTPDGKRIIMVAGNNTTLPETIQHSRVPRNWNEDHLLGRMPDARGHNANRMAPGGFIMSLDPDGSNRELIATGFRNPYDIALNHDGELFTYDADMEWDVGTPWYRPTRVNHVISGGEFGWRNGTGKWPAYYPDSFGAAVDIGPGSPTGICFGYDSDFPAKYRDALFIADWSYGIIHAVSLSEDGASYSGTYETFATAAPLPVTDMVIHNGAMYLTIGGRETQSGLYRIHYTGEGVSDETPDAANMEQNLDAATLRVLRGQLESLHVADAELPSSVDEAVSMAIEYLDHDDRAIRYAARVALEHRDAEHWKANVLDAESPRTRTLGVIALARCGVAADQSAAMESLLELPFNTLSTENRIAYLRAAGLVAMRLGELDEQQRTALIEKLDGSFPSGIDSVDRELAMMLVYLRAPDATNAVLSKLLDSPSQESQIHYAMTLRGVADAMNDAQRKELLGWFHEMATARGGMSFGGFLENIKRVFVDGMSESEQERLASAINPPTPIEDAITSEARPLVKQWTVGELESLVSDSPRPADFENGKEMFAVAQCYKCHRMGLQGGILGPDLTSAGGKFNVHDLLVSIIEPSKVISDQYGATQFLTEDGEAITGRVINMRRNELLVLTNMLDPSSLTVVDRDSIEETFEAKISMMPTGLLDTLTSEEIVDLIAYLRSGGNPDHRIYTESISTK
ncbi:c-type cytochrome [Aporhodopirellula aestuarii]|uniref:C-type cytochrome n=1 Tax=Aporhodopirellula aestuarii TaxID=2950107 RepID=A0ABT0U299_9BACT|nr:c-type cytochrome [Aporhodopirellula aestuarii]MCM2371032.1 c-type cytochrome [Aporhodopirellula aestuarii]